MLVIALACLAFAVSAGLTWYLARPGAFPLMLDLPNERSLHREPVPRSGGIAISCAVFGAGAAMSFAGSGGVYLPWLALAGVLICAVSFVDDRAHVPVLYRMLVHFGVAVLLIHGGLSINHLDLPGMHMGLPAWVQVSLSVLFIMWMTNLYNFMDGMDGFAAGMAVIGFGTLAMLAWPAGHSGFAVLSLVIAAASGGFLVFNYPPAGIFMGDVGAALLGMLAAALVLWGHQQGIFPLWIGLLVFSPFIVDATATLIRRLARREKVWRAHKTHFYQRLVELGWSHRRTVNCEYALMITCSVTALAAIRGTPAFQRVLLFAWLVTYTVLMILVGLLERRRRRP